MFQNKSKKSFTDLLENQVIQKLSDEEMEKINGGFSGSTTNFPKYRSNETSSSCDGTNTGKPALSGSVCAFPIYYRDRQIV